MKLLLHRLQVFYLFDGLTFRDEKLVGLLHYASAQNGIEEGIVFSLFFSCDDLSHFAVLVVVVEKSKQFAYCRPGKCTSRDTREQPTSKYLEKPIAYIIIKGLIGSTNGNGALSVVLPDVVVDCTFKTIPWTALTSSM
jgi:hypothetical protein